jgi:hypothetical protein
MRRGEKLFLLMALGLQLFAALMLRDFFAAFLFD